MLKIKFYTLGCKVNQYETQAVREYFLSRGYQEVNKEPADFYIINTCTVTKTADTKSLKYIRRAKKESPNARIAVLGCLVEKNPELFEEEGVELWSNREKAGIIESKNIWDLKISQFHHNRAFVKIQDGCDNHCSYCKVSLVRGASISRPYKDIIREIEGLLNNGFREIVLCGINLGSWCYEDKQFIVLLRDLIALKNMGRIRLSSIEAQYVTQYIIDLAANEEKLCSHFHIPFQSGDSDVLKKMDKSTGAKFYLDLIDKIRKNIPDCGISCDLMVGFPDETKEGFENSLKLLKHSQAVRTHIFPYSPRPGTKSYAWGRIDNKELKMRLESAQETAMEVSYEFRKSQLNKVFKVALDADSTKKSKMGYTDNYIRVTLDKSINSKDLFPAKIKKVDIDATHAYIVK